MKILFAFYVATLFLFINGCKDSTTNPIPPASRYTLMESGFENQGQPSLSNWKDGYPIYGLKTSRYSFSNDVPTDGGQWSLKLNPVDSNYSTLRFTVLPEQPSQSKQFVLTYLRKDLFSSHLYNVSLSAYSGSNGYSIPVQTKDSTNWVQDTIKYSSNSLTIDSLVVFITMFAPNTIIDTSKYILLDKFKLEQF